MSKPTTQQKARNVSFPSPQRAEEGRQVFGRFYDPIRRRWMLLTNDGPMPEPEPPIALPIRDG